MCATPPSRPPPARRGVASVLAMMFLVIFGSLAAAMAVVAALYLDLVDRTLHPTQLLQCQQTRWFDLTDGRLRGTGVGRYAGIAGLIAVSGLWQDKWRPVWLVVFLTSLTLLLYSGARGSFGGFAAGAIRPNTKVNTA